MYIKHGVVASQFDYDALLFLNAAGITDSTQRLAINYLVFSLKVNGLWSKMNAIYPMVGGTATTHKFNLKNPVDSNAAYRLTFFGGWTHSSTGALPNGTNAYANTFLATNSLTSNSNHLSIYVRTAQTLNAVPIGSFSADPFLFQLNISTATGFYYYSGGLSTQMFSSLANSLGFFVGTTRANNDRKTFRNAVQQASLTTSINTSYNALNNYIGARNTSNTATNFSGQEIALASIGSGLTDGEVTIYYNITQAYQTILSRNI
jgi:hypothetical protein